MPAPVTNSQRLKAKRSVITATASRWHNNGAVKRQVQAATQNVTPKCAKCRQALRHKCARYGHSRRNAGGGRSAPAGAYAVVAVKRHNARRTKHKTAGGNAWQWKAPQLKSAVCGSQPPAVHKSIGRENNNVLSNAYT